MLKPLGKRVVIKLKEVEEKTLGGLVLPSSAKEKQSSGEVLAISKEVAELDEVHVGDQVVFDSFAGAEVKYNGQEYIVVDLEHVLAVLG